MAQVWQRQCAANCYNIHCNEREYLHKQNMKIQISMHVQTHVTTYRNICVCVLNYTVRHKCGHKNLSHVSDSRNSIWYFSLFSVFWRFVNVYILDCVYAMVCCAGKYCYRCAYQSHSVFRCLLSACTCAMFRALSSLLLPFCG